MDKEWTGLIKPRKSLRGFSFNGQEGGTDMYQAGLVLEGGSTRGIFTAGAGFPY